MTRASRVEGDQGTVLVLVLGFAAIALVLVAVVVDASAVVLAKREVAAAADGAAVSAAQSLDEAALYAGGLDGALPVDGQEAAARVAAYQAGLVQRPGSPVVLRLTAVEGGTTVVVTGSRRVVLPLRVPGGPQAVDVAFTARATAPVVLP